MSERPLLCINPACRKEEDGGPRRTEPGFWFCWICVRRVRENLTYIAGAWADLEANLGSASSSTSEPVGGSRDVGLVINERAVAARARATSDLWAYARIVFDWADSADRSLASPSDQTPPGLARWIEARHVEVFTKHAGMDTALAFVDDMWTIRRMVHGAAYPSGVRMVPTGLRCTEKGVSDQGEPVPCAGMMRARMVPDSETLPDLICSEDRTHVIDPTTWQRAGWKHAHRSMDPAAAQRLADTLGA